MYEDRVSGDSPQIYDVYRFAVRSGASHSLLYSASIEVLLAVHDNGCMPDAIELHRLLTVSPDCTGFYIGQAYGFGSYTKWDQQV